MFKYFILLLSFCLITIIGSSQSNPCAQLTAYKVVVLGSSTAAGAGVSSSDSAWVNRYRNYLESINPNNEVINLAVGGYNTYKIMPSGFTPPSNRPSPDINKNITAALALNPDAIIVNMPSNDVASGFNYNEQMFNLDSIFQLSNDTGVPMWICTTQPRNFSDTNKLNLQYELKDSIEAIFNPFDIDFWTDFAATDFTINPSFNSGDGVHLNDTAHALMLERVKAVNILNYLYNPPNHVDYGIFSVINQFESNCGDSSAWIQVVIANHGVLDSSNGTLNISMLAFNTGMNSTQLLTFAPIPSCEMDTLDFYINTYQASTYQITLNVAAINDTNLVNDTLSINIATTGRPEQLSLFDTLCDPGFGYLALPAVNGDSVLWFHNLSDTIPFHSGNEFQTPFISNDQTWFVNSIRGDLFNNADLSTTNISNINWSGAMLNIMPHENLWIDSVGLKILHPGQQSVDIYYKLGSYLGHENNAGSWTLLTTSTANVTDSLALTFFALPSLQVFANDTLGFYFQMNNNQSKMGYKTMSSPKTRSNDEISIFTGSGVSYNFTNNYYPRDLNCTFHYHFENTSYGSCNSGKYPATIYVSDYSFSLGNDTIIDIQDTLHLSIPALLTNWYWHDGSTDSVLIISANDLGVGIHYITLNGEDSLGCPVSDELILGVADLVGIDGIESAPIELFPNPAQNWLDIKTDHEIGAISLLGVDGRLIRSYLQFPIDITDIAGGNYFIKIEQDGVQFTLPLIKN